MDHTKEPNFLSENQSVASLINQLHQYFKNSYAHYKVQRSTLLSQIEAAQENEAALQQQLREVEVTLSLFGVLSDSLSVADRALHMSAVMKELGVNSSVYKIHHKTPEAE